MESQPYSDAEAEFGRIADAATAECKATKQSVLNLSDIQLEKKAKTTTKPAPQKPKETEVPEPEPQELVPTEAETAKDPLSS